jgi:SAM-dependent methyltransferase
MSVSAAAFARNEYGLSVMTCPLEALPATSRYDVVVAIHTLEHIVDPVAALATIRGALRAGGYVYLEVPSGVSWAVRLRGERSEVFTDEHLYFHSPRSLDALLSNAGFEAIRVHTVEEYTGLFNTLLSELGIVSAVRGVTSRLRDARANGPPDSSPPAGAPAREPVIDAGRSVLVGTATMAGIAATPLRWLLGVVGLGGAVFGTARKPG